MYLHHVTLENHTPVKLTGAGNNNASVCGEHCYDCYHCSYSYFDHCNVHDSTVDIVNNAILIKRQKLQGQNSMPLS